jgi:hypothetical protein
MVSIWLISGRFGVKRHQTLAARARYSMISAISLPSGPTMTI